MLKKSRLAVFSAIIICIIILGIYIFSLFRKNNTDLSFLNINNFITLYTQEESVKIVTSENKTIEVVINKELRELFIPSYEKWQVTDKKPNEDNEAISIYLRYDPPLYITFYSDQNITKITQNNNERFYMITDDVIIYDTLKHIVDSK